MYPENVLDMLDYPKIELKIFESKYMSFESVDLFKADANS